MSGTGSKGFRLVVGVAAGLALMALTACGSPGTGTASASASPSASPSATSAGSYLNCLLQHGGGGPG